MIIRKATSSDSSQLIDLYSEFKGENYKTDKDHGLHIVLSDPDSFILVAEIRRELVGLAAISTRYVVRYPRPIMQLEELFIKEQYRRHGIAKKMLHTMETIAKDMNVHAMYIESRSDLSKAHAFYEACDFKNDGYYFKKVL